MSKIPIMKTERLLLRPITHGDLEAMYDYSSSENVARYVTYELRGYKGFYGINF
ncbi:GNAT family N-acetyltransferase [Lysinibacillus sp. A4]|uniref:GNAT family N-acetyltransferase n=1 Tax=Lysinibacillus sp. A4 TaxID=2976269 RepID=UPI0037C9A86D